MCGIAGIVGRGWEPESLSAMVGALAHRGPDAQRHRELTSDPDGPRVGLGHARLSILDLSDAGLQPMASASGDLHVVHNGEIYNYLELRRELGGEERFRTGTDTEVLLAAYEEWGDACVERFIGMFAFALWDGRRRRLFCARDRLGIKPFHYGWAGDAFVFASEVRALFRAGVDDAPDRGAWADYLVHGYYDHDDRTFFRAVRSLEPGHTLVWEDDRSGEARPGRVVSRRYWSLVEAAGHPFEEADPAERWGALLGSAVGLRLRSDVPVGVNLSGGLDSAALMATVDGLAGPGASIETFTAAFDDPTYDETDFAAAVTHAAQWVRNVERVGEADCRRLLGEVAHHQSAPFGGVATIGYHALHGLARQRGVTVLLEGQGVDELLGGYAYFRPLHYLDLVEAGREDLAAREAAEFGDDLRAAVAWAREEAAGPSSPRYQDGSRHLRPECLDPDLVAEAGPRPTFAKPFDTHLQNGLYRDLLHTKLPRVLRMNDRLSMAFGRELREPYLDHRLVELAFRLPASERIGQGENKRLLRRWMQGRLPDAVRSASKRGVVTPQREWLRGPWQAIVRDALTSPVLRDTGWIRPARALAEFERFAAGEGDNAFFVWQWIMVAHLECFR